MEYQPLRLLIFCYTIQCSHYFLKCNGLESRPLLEWLQLLFEVLHITLNFYHSCVLSHIALVWVESSMFNLLNCGFANVQCVGHETKHENDPSIILTCPNELELILMFAWCPCGEDRSAQIASTYVFDLFGECWVKGIWRNKAKPRSISMSFWIQLFSFEQIDMEKKKEEEEEEPWSHPDVTLPHLLSLSQALLDILCLASGFQSTGSPALWRPQDVKRALGWASLLQQVIFYCVLLLRSKF